MNAIAAPLVPLTHTRVKQQLRKQLRKKPPGHRLPSIRALSRQLGTGYVNTHRAVHELALEGMLVSRPGLGTFIAPAESGEDEVAPSEARRTTRVAVIHSLLSSEGFVLEMVNGFKTKLREKGWSCIDKDYDGWNPLLPGYDEADALVIVNPSSHEPLRCDPRQVMVVMDTSANTSVGMPGRFDLVTVEQEQGGLLLGQLARECNPKLPAFIGVRARKATTGFYDLTSSMRLRGFEHGFGEPLPDAQHLCADCYGPGAGARFMASYVRMNPRPDFLFAASDDIAIGIVTGGLALGLEPGRDYQVVGFDGQFAGRRLETGPLTTINAPTLEMGKRAAELLADRLENPDQPVRRVSLGCSLVLGNTTRRERINK